jgi:hypothetical protein
MSLSFTGLGHTFYLGHAASAFVYMRLEYVPRILQAARRALGFYECLIEYQEHVAWAFPWQQRKRPRRM